MHRFCVSGICVKQLFELIRKSCIFMHIHNIHTLIKSQSTNTVGTVSLNCVQYHFEQYNCLSFSLECISYIKRWMKITLVWLLNMEKKTKLISFFVISFFFMCQPLCVYLKWKKGKYDEKNPLFYFYLPVQHFYR